VQHGVFGYGGSNGITAIFITWPEVNTHAFAGGPALDWKAILLLVVVLDVRKNAHYVLASNAAVMFARFVPVISSHVRLWTTTVKQSTGRDPPRSQAARQRTAIQPHYPTLPTCNYVNNCSSITVFCTHAVARRLRCTEVIEAWQPWLEAPRGKIWEVSASS